MSEVHEAQGPDFRLNSSFFPLQPVTFILRLCALSLIEPQKQEEIELQIELHLKVIWTLKRYSTDTELLPIGI